MTITSMEALAAMPMGSQIRVDSQTSGRIVFERTQQGWTREGYPVPDSLFSGYVQTGKVSDLANLTPLPGNWYESTRYWYLVMRVDAEADTATCVRFHRTGNVDPMDHRTPLQTLLGTRVHPLADVPAGVLTAPIFRWVLNRWRDADERWRSESETAEALREERAVLKNRPEPGPLREQLAQVDAALAALRGLIGGDLEPF